MTIITKRRRMIETPRRSRAFTLIELMIVVAIIAILAAIAVPTYERYITKTRRAAATACLSEYSNYMERYYTTNLRYDQDTANPPVTNTLPVLDCAAASQTGAFYQYSFAASPALSPSTYKIIATPLGVQLARDTQCGTLALDQSGKRYYGDGTRDDSAGLDICWQH